jgi:hypothetical protein
MAFFVGFEIGLAGVKTKACSGIITWVLTKFLKSKGINRKNKIEILRSDIGFFNYLKYLANESKAEKWVKRLVTL